MRVLLCSTTGKYQWRLIRDPWTTENQLMCEKKMIKLQASEATDTSDIDNLALRYRKHTASRNRGQIP
jgi:hypothetical protein